MCDFISAATVATQIGGEYLSQRSTAKEAQRMGEARAAGAWQDYNYAYMNYELERNDAFDAAIAEITKTRLNSMQLNSNVIAAVNENMGSSRTGRLLVRNVEGDVARTVASMQENYTQKSNEIDINEDTKRTELHSTLVNINNSMPKMPSALTNALTTAAVGLNAYTGYANRKASVEATGNAYNPLTGGAKIKKNKG